MAPALPEEIIREEILTRLPTKSLLRCRSVCKSWSSLIFDPAFIRSILNRDITPDPNKDDLLILLNVCQPKSSRGLSILSRNNLSETRIGKLPYPFTHEKVLVHLLGSINGLICMACSHECDCQFFIWNPAISLWKTILAPRHDSFDLKNSYLHLLGFGWDSVENDYKLIAKTKNYNVTDVNNLEFFVYSSKADSWSIGVASDWSILYNYIHLYSPSVIVKGIPYWMSKINNIIKFEIRNNKFTIFNFGVPKSLRLLNLNDCLAVLEHTSYGADVYHFDEESRERKKMYSIINSNILFLCYRPMCFKYGGEIVLVYGGKNNLYDPKSEEYKILCHPPGHKDFVCGFSYTPSMLALEGMKPLQRKINKNRIQAGKGAKRQRGVKYLKSKKLEKKSNIYRKRKKKLKKLHSGSDL